MNPCHTHIFIIDSSLSVFFFIHSLAFSLLLLMCVNVGSSKLLGMHLSESNWHVNAGIIRMCVSDQYTYHILTNFFANSLSLSYMFFFYPMLIHSMLPLFVSNIFPFSYGLAAMRVITKSKMRMECEKRKKNRKRERSSVWNLYICKLFFLRFAIQQTSRKIILVFLFLFYANQFRPCEKSALLLASLLSFQINRQNKNRFFIIRAIWMLSVLCMSMFCVCVYVSLITFSFAVQFLNNRKEEKK